MDSDWRIIAILIGAITGVYGWLLKHLSNASKHPCKDDIVFRDVCDEKTKRLDDCIEVVVKRSDERCAEHKRITEARHLELKRDMKEGFTEIKQLIKNKN